MSHAGQVRSAARLGADEISEPHLVLQRVQPHWPAARAGRWPPALRGGADARHARRSHLDGRVRRRCSRELGAGGGAVLKLIGQLQLQIQRLLRGRGVGGEGRSETGAE